MLSTMPSVSPDSQRTLGGPMSELEDDRLCAGCRKSVSSDSGGVVVAFGNSLWHVDCFKCAKCGNQVNADTNLLLLSDGSPVCANCYNCKVCKKPILDEAVMTGDDSFHAECFTCRSCKNRIDELVFAKTSQGFYCMKCHNERVARSRRHMAKQKQRERERERERDRERAALGSSAGRSTASSNSTGEAGQRGNEHATGIQSQSRLPSSPDDEANVPNTGETAATATAAALTERRRSGSPAPPVSVTVAGPSKTPNGVNGYHQQYTSTINENSTLPPPPSYTKSQQSLSGEDSALGSALYGNGNGNGANSNGPSSGANGVGSTVEPGSPSPSMSVSVSHDGGSSNDHSVSSNRTSSTGLALSNSGSGSGSRGQAETLAQLGEGGSYNAELRRGSFDDGSQRGLQPKTGVNNTTDSSGSGSSSSGGTSGGLVVRKREKRASINPGLQLEASKMFHSYSQSQRPTSPSSSRTQSQSPGSAASQRGGRESPRVTSPLRDYFLNNEDESGSTTVYSPSHSQPQTSNDGRTLSPTSPRSAPVPVIQNGSGSSPSSGSSMTKPESTNSKFPTRFDSLHNNSTNNNADASASNSAPPSARPGLPSSPYNGRLNMGGTTVPQLRAQRSFDVRGTGGISRFDTSTSATTGTSFGVGLTGASAGGNGAELDRRSRSVSPKPPDVPRSIESGTDTETDNGNESDDIMRSYMDGGDRDRDRGFSRRPPVPPPKDGGEIRSRSGSGSAAGVVVTGATGSGTNEGDDVLFSSEREHTSAVTERTSGFFIAPALPPVRFSMSGMDFNDILGSIGATSSKRLSRVGGGGPTEAGMIPEENGEDGRVRGEREGEDVAMARTPTSATSTITPLGDSSSLENSTTISKMNGVGSNSMSSSSSEAAGGANTERKPSMKIKRVPPPELHPTNGNTKGNGTLSSTTSPTSPQGFGSSRRTSSRDYTGKVFVDENGGMSITTTSPRSSTESRRSSTPRLVAGNGRDRADSRSTPATVKHDSAELVTRRLKEALSDATDRSADYIKLDRAFVEAILLSLDQRKDQVDEMSYKLDTFKRKSQMMFDGLSVAQREYTQELAAARRSAEVEVSRLKIELSGQAARITALTTDERRREVQEKRSKELEEGLDGLEQEWSKLKVERDMTLAEVEELTASKASSIPNGEVPVASVSRSLTMRLDNIKRQYQHELVPLTQQREALVREISDLKEARDIFLEETAVLNARNEELAQLNTQYERRLEYVREKSLPPLGPLQVGNTGNTGGNGVGNGGQTKTPFDSWKSSSSSAAAHAPVLVNTTSTSSSSTLIDDGNSTESGKRTGNLNGNGNGTEINSQRRGFRWPGNKGNTTTTTTTTTTANNNSNNSYMSSTTAAPLVPAVSPSVVAGGENGTRAGAGTGKVKKRVEHAFQQLSILRFAKCDLCGDKMWGSQVRCTVCNLSVHVRCAGQVHTACTHDGAAAGMDDLAPVGPPPPSMFGRDLIEQVRDDSKNSEVPLFVPVIVTKCIEAVEANAMEYEGIYRKSGGSGQSKAITALFERGDYDSFNLADSESFNDVSSITSVLKNYFRQLPNPLLTFGMHEAFVGAGTVKDPQIKGQALKDLVKQLPAEHYHTLAKLMLHLHNIQLRADVNLMNARNLGVVFGPTLMRSADPSREFADMAGKSLAIEYLIENAPSVFPSIS